MLLQISVRNMLKDFYVSEISLDSNNLTKTGTLVTPVDFQHLKDVFVITVNKQDSIEEGEQ